MTAEIKKLYRGGKKNKTFLLSIKTADGDTAPGLLSDDITKHLFASMYYGWLVAMYGNTWKHFI